MSVSGRSNFRKIPEHAEQVGESVFNHQIWILRYRKSHRWIISAYAAEIKPRHYFIRKISFIRPIKQWKLTIWSEMWRNLPKFIFPIIVWYIPTYCRKKCRNPTWSHEERAIEALCDIRPILRNFASFVYSVKPPMSTKAWHYCTALETSFLMI